MLAFKLCTSTSVVMLFSTVKFHQKVTSSYFTLFLYKKKKHDLRYPLNR